MKTSVIKLFCSVTLCFCSLLIHTHVQAQTEVERQIVPQDVPESISFMVTVYEHDCSFITLNHEGETYKLVSNIDFSEFAFLNKIEHAGKKYSLLILTHHIDQKQLKIISERTGRSSEYEKLLKIAEAQLHALGQKPGYIVLGDNSKSAPREVFKHVDMLLDYYQLHKYELSAKKSQHETLQEQKRREKELEDAKPKKPTPVLKAVRKTNS